MRSSMGFLLAPAFFLVAIPVSAQVSNGTSQPSRAPTEMHEQDGGTFEVLQSIVVPPMPHAPFAATLETEWVKYLYTGGTITLVNRRRIARDSSGRIYQERWFLVPKAGNAPPQMRAIEIADPIRHVLYNCLLRDPDHLCRQVYYAPSSSTVGRSAGPPSGPLPNETGYANHEDLGKQQLVGVETVGTRDSVTYNPGRFGNDTPMTIEREFWYAPQLGINLLSKLADPRFGNQTFTVTEITLGDPDQLA